MLRGIRMEAGLPRACEETVKLIELHDGKD